MIQHGFSANRKPILEPLDTIENRNALIEFCTAEGAEERQYREAEWPEAEFIVGNPPFLGGSKMRGELGDEYTSVLRTCYKGRVPGSADLVTYWFEKARELIVSDKTTRVGFVATNAIRQSQNRPVLSTIVKGTRIFNAWSDEPWVNEGAAVRVSLICFGQGDDASILDGVESDVIYADLTAKRKSRWACPRAG